LFLLHVSFCGIKEELVILLPGEVTAIDEEDHQSYSENSPRNYQSEQRRGHRSTSLTDLPEVENPGNTYAQHYRPNVNAGRGLFRVERAGERQAPSTWRPFARLRNGWIDMAKLAR
jgi:hypothetical protein